MNISDEIMAYQEALGLETISTGGGFDYVYATAGQGLGRGGVKVELLLTAMDDGGLSPSDLHEQACVVVYTDDESWMEGAQHYFKTAQQAMDFMKTYSESHAETWLAPDAANLYSLKLTADEMTVILTTLKDGVGMRRLEAEKTVEREGVYGDQQHADRHEALQRAIEATNTFTEARNKAL